MSAAETELIEQARRGDRLALERLLIDRAGQLRTHLLRGLPTRVKGLISIDDVVQETLTRAFLKIDQLRGDSRREFTVWLQAIGNMILIDLVRKETTQARGGEFCRRELAHDNTTGSVVEILGQLPVDQATASQIVARREAVAALQVAIAGLPSDQRQAIQLHLLKGKTLQETSDAMDRSTTAVRGLLYRAKENLAEAMGRASLWLSRR